MIPMLSERAYVQNAPHVQISHVGYLLGISRFMNGGMLEYMLVLDANFLTQIPCKTTLCIFVFVVDMQT